MGRAYAGILGPLAFAVLMVRGLIRGTSLETTFVAASIGLFAFAAIGCLIGAAGRLIVEDSVRARLQAERDLRLADGRGEAKETQ